MYGQRDRNIPFCDIPPCIVSYLSLFILQFLSKNHLRGRRVTEDFIGSIEIN